MGVIYGIKIGSVHLVFGCWADLVYMMVLTVAVVGGVCLGVEWQGCDLCLVCVCVWGGGISRRGNNHQSGLYFRNGA